MRNSLTLLAAATPLAFGLSSQAALAVADIVTWSIVDGADGSFRECGIEVGSNAEVMRVKHPGAPAWGPGGLPNGFNQNSSRSNHTRVRVELGSGPQQDQWMRANMSGNWAIELDDSQLLGVVSDNDYPWPSMRTFARLDSDSEARLREYRGVGNLQLSLQTPLSIDVRLAVYDARIDGLRELGGFPPLSSGMSVFVPEQAFAAAIEPTQLMLITRTNPTLRSFRPPGDDPSQQVSVRLWGINASTYAINIPAPGAAALVGMAAVLVRRRRN